MEMKEIENKSESCSQKKWCSTKWMMVMLIVLCTVLNIWSTYIFINWLPAQLAFLKSWNTSANVTIDDSWLINKINSKIEEIEAMKVWWTENYEMLKKLYSNEKFKEQQKAQLSMAVAQFGWSDDSSDNGSGATDNSNNNSDTNPNWFTTWKLTAEEINKLKENWRISWNKDAKISWLEFSDLECPFCKKLHDNWTVKDIKAKYWDSLNYMIKSFPLPFHQNAQKASEAMECVWELWWDEKYYEFEQKAFEWQDVSMDNLKKIVKSLWIKESKFNKCVDSWKYADKVNSQKKEWEDYFKIQGTPGSVLINIETGEWTLIPWAYPTSEFEKVIDWLLSK